MVPLAHGRTLRLDREPGSGSRYTVGLWAGIGLAGAMTGDAEEIADLFCAVKHMEKIVNTHGLPHSR